MLYLVQHGEATDKATNPERPLTEGGEVAMGHLGAFLARAGVPVGHIWESGKLRARQSAEILAEHLTPGQLPEETEGLGATDPVAPITARLRQGEELMVVSHLPLVGGIAGELVAGAEDRPPVAFTPGTAVALQWHGEEGWQVAWMIRPELLR
jgi:phosphohistidine phosphatase